MNHPLPPYITTTPSTATTTTSSSSSKKKFGKNLTKLIYRKQQQQQPSVPPIAGLNSKSIYKSNVAGNLVLLSTKKKKKEKSSGLDSCSNNDTTSSKGGVSSSSSASNSAIGPNNCNTDNLNDNDHGNNESSLLSSSSSSNKKMESNKNGGFGASSSSTLATTTKLNSMNIIIEDVGHHDDNDGNNNNNGSTQDKIVWGGMNNKKKKEKGSVESIEQPQPQNYNEINQQSISSSTSKTNHNNTNTNDTNGNSIEQDQVEFMKKLAKEKTEKLRQEEEYRIKEQKERAALRLKELELKIAKNSSGNGSGKSLNDASFPHASRSYSSLVGGSGNTNVTQDVRHVERQQQQPQNQQSSHHNINHNEDHQNTTSSFLPPPLAMMSTFHLSSYDDRDRGMVRNVNAGPRMLFDPKSGSMVAVQPKKDESHKNNNGGGSSDRDRGGNGNSRSKKEKNKSKSRGDEDCFSDGKDGKNSKRKNKNNKKDKKRDEKRGISSGGQKQKRMNITSSTTTFTTEKNGKCNGTKNPPLNNGRLPRTKGVLYKRGDNGKFISADGCEGDQGYGAHSVPGGRVKNPKAYASHMKKLQEENEKYAFTYQEFNDTNGVNHGYANWHQQYTQNPGPWLDRSHFMRKKSLPKEDFESKEEDESQSNNNHVPSPLRVTGDDKLELLTGMNDSPTLQATAAEWAPSQAALALAAANANKAVKDNNDGPKSSEDKCERLGNTHHSASFDLQEDDEDMEESGSVQCGLGFDPTKDMDAVIKSPDFSSSMDGEIGSPRIPKLLFERNSKPDSKAINPFAHDMMLSSSPWGGNLPSTESLGSLANWDYSLTTENKDGDDEINPSQGKANIPGSQSFLSLSAFNGEQNTWGSSGLLSAFNETSYGSPSSTG